MTLTTPAGPADLAVPDVLDADFYGFQNLLTPVE